MQVTLIEQGEYRYQLTVGESRHQVLASESEIELKIELDGQLHRVQRDLGGKVRAPSPALVIGISVAVGDSVSAGQRLGLLEAMKTETAIASPVSGTVREILTRAGERVAAGDALLVIEPEGEGGLESQGPALDLPALPDPLLSLIRDSKPDLAAAGQLASGERSAAVGALRGETRRILMGYDVNAERADLLDSLLSAPVDALTEAFRADLSGLIRSLEIAVDVDTLFSRAPTRVEGEELGPSNDSRMAMYMRRISIEGEGIEPSFLDALRRALKHYDIQSLEPGEGLERVVLRMFCTRQDPQLRERITVGLLQLAIRLAQAGEQFDSRHELEGVLDRLALLRGTVSPSIADLASHARFILFDRPRAERLGSVPSTPSDIEATLVAAPDAARLKRLAAEVGLSEEVAARIELWRLENFTLEPIETFDGIYTFRGRARDKSGDDRLFCIAEVDDLGPDVPENPDVPRFERSFQEAVEALRILQSQCDPGRRLQWNRLYILVRPPVVLRPELLTGTLRRMAPQTGHLGLEKVVVRLATVDPASTASPAAMMEVLAGNPTGSRVEFSIRDPHQLPLAPASPYERRVAAARGRGLIDPYEVVRLFTASPSRSIPGPGRPLGPGAFIEYDLIDEELRPVDRPPGQNTCGVVTGVITTPTSKYPEGMRRVLILGDPSFGMGALAGPECDRICAAIRLAEREKLPVEWVSVSSGAKIAMDSGTENLDATARVVRNIVTFTDAGGEINLIVAGVNVGAQSYFDALATMGLQSRGVLIMLPTSSMVLTGRAALEVSGAVSAEDEPGIGGYERIMGPSGQAHFQARDIADAYEILLQHYGVTYRMAGEGSPRIFDTRDEADRDVTAFAIEAEEGFESVGEIFSTESNGERKRPFAMRPIMRALIDQDGSWQERWRDWVGAETAITWDCHLGGYPVALVGIESRGVARTGYIPTDGPDTWTAGTLFPLSSKKVARALNAASGNRPAVILANLSGFDGSPESMRRGVLELGAEIARSVVRFQGPILFTVVSRYHGGAYVVFSRELNDEMRVTAIKGSFASVIGGAAAAAVVFPREVRRRANADERVKRGSVKLASAPDPASRVAARAELEETRRQVTLEMQSEVASEFDAVHSVERARDVGSLERILSPSELRPRLIEFLKTSPGGSR